MSAGRAFHLPDGDPPESAPLSAVAGAATAPTRLTSTLAQFTLPAADASRQGISPVTLNVALLTPCLDTEQGDERGTSAGDGKWQGVLDSEGWER